MDLKKIFFVIFAVITMASCSDDDSYEYHYELLPVEDAQVPEVFEYGKIYDLTVTYLLPDDCYVNNDILYEYENTSRNIAVVSLVIESNDCEDLELEQELTFRVHALQKNPYIFNFWQGDDENGEPIYLTVEVPVINISNVSANEFEETHTEM
ncbi:hypothetical protein LCM02_11360 [Lutimonas saemankumensis]|uniref:hypothetical protein n=1 Tax=Lutimonas saemankumensis TaxID=483016 RepID=UPI001CD2E922|nr:hypothetical protein [Lutimonas saemankumensis]MCA0933052.1 hypothetical protein [Lutimonas saemankumensis]